MLRKSLVAEARDCLNDLKKKTQRLCGRGTGARMADPLVIVDKIIEIAITIKYALELVREDDQECRDTVRLVWRVREVLSLLKDSEVFQSPAMSGPLTDLSEAVARAHELIMNYHRRRHVVCLSCAGRNLSKRLRGVRDDISQRMMLAIFATNAAAIHFTVSIRQLPSTSVGIFTCISHSTS